MALSGKHEYIYALLQSPATHLPSILMFPFMHLSMLSHRVGKGGGGGGGGLPTGILNFLKTKSSISPGVVWPFWSEYSWGNISNTKKYAYCYGRLHLYSGVHIAVFDRMRMFT